MQTRVPRQPSTSIPRSNAVAHGRVPHPSQHPHDGKASSPQTPLPGSPSRYRRGMTVDSARDSANHPNSEVDVVANRYWDRLVEASPTLATDLGADVRQDEYDDFSPAGLEHTCQLAADALVELDRATPTDEVDRVTIAAMRSLLGLEIETHDHGYDLLSLNGIESGLHAIRRVYDAMPTDTPQQWHTIARRLHAVPAAVNSWLESQRASARAGMAPARRQVDLLVEQARSWVAGGGFFDTYLANATTDHAELPTDIKDELADGITVAKEAFGGASEILAGEIAELATDQDAVGIDRYQLASRAFLGSAIDLAETYEWGKQELARIVELQHQTAERIRPGASVAEAMAVLDADPAYQIHGTDALREWMQSKADEAMANLGDTHVNIPEPARRVEGMIAPTHDGGVYYTGPSDDFSRPGRMWWAVPEGVTGFTTWRELTTVYHEGVPGHHLQISSAIAQKDTLNSWRRFAGQSGPIEGWALYAEWLMADLGYMDDPGYFMGLLDGQSLRAARVVLDIGLHCQFEAPAEVGGGEWTWDKAWRFFNNHASMDEATARFELNRYFGWPGQAPAYKIGERTWLQTRADCRAKNPDGFSLKDFHTRALALGSLPLDLLHDTVVDTEPMP